MKRNTALLLAGVGTAGVLTAIAYRNGVKNIDFEIDDIQPTGDFSQLLLRIKCTNRNLLFGYPVPQIHAVVFTNQDVEIGTVINTMLQYIPANQVSYITAVIHPNFSQAFNIIMSTIGQGHLPSNLTFTGEIKVGPIVIPFDTHTGIFSAIGSTSGDSKKAVDKVRSESKNVPRGIVNGRRAVVVRTHDPYDNRTWYGVQFWTAEMVAEGISTNTDKSTSTFLDYL